MRIVSCHLGNGASVAAIEHGRSVDTSMGMTPLEGLVMGTRAGDLDPGIVLELVQSGSFGGKELDALLNRQSGMAGLTGTNDMREIERRAAAGDEDCRRALALYAYRVRKYIGAYAAVMGGVDAIAFTGGVGENSATIRQACLERLEFLGAAIVVVKADEELAMAIEAAALLRPRYCHFQFLISGMSSPWRVMYSRCSTSLSRTRWRRCAACAPSPGT